MNNIHQQNKPERDQLNNSTNVDFVDIYNTKWNGVIKSDFGDTVVTMNSITGLFARSSSLPDNLA